MNNTIIIPAEDVKLYFSLKPYPAMAMLLNICAAKLSQASNQTENNKTTFYIMIPVSAPKYDTLLVHL